MAPPAESLCELAATSQATQEFLGESLQDREAALAAAEARLAALEAKAIATMERLAANTEHAIHLERLKEQRGCTR